MLNVSGQAMEDNDVVIVGGARTPFCEWLGGKRGDGGPGGRLSSISAEELGTIADIVSEVLSWEEVE